MKPIFIYNEKLPIVEALNMMLSTKTTSITAKDDYEGEKMSEKTKFNNFPLSNAFSSNENHDFPKVYDWISSC